MSNGLCSKSGCANLRAWKGLCTKHYQQDRAGKKKYEHAATKDEYILQRVEAIPFSGCIVWTGVTNNDGYGVLVFKGKRESAHKASWELRNGAVPDGLQLNHKCDVRCCINPSHLYLGTQKENVKDSFARGNR